MIPMRRGIVLMRWINKMRTESLAEECGKNSKTLKLKLTKLANESSKVVSLKIKK